MGRNTKIEWTDHTANLWWGCTSVHEGCDNCYAEAWANRHGKKVWGNDSPRAMTKSVWNDFMKWQAEAHAAGEIRRVFVGSMMDIFERPMPVVDWQGNVVPKKSDDDNLALLVAGAQVDMRMDTSDLRKRFFRDIVPACPNLDFLLLTKRPSNINKYIPESWKSHPPSNVMFGTSIVNMATWENLIYHMKKVNGRKFLSLEPQLDWIRPTRFQALGIDWIIQGGESGPRRRPFDIEWARWMKGFCESVGIPYFFKQVDKVIDIPEDLMVRQFPPQNWLK